MVTAKTNRPTWEDTSNPIVQAVAPLKNDAMDRAEKKAREIVKKIREQLKAANNDAQVVAPYPDSNLRRADYMVAQAKYTMVRKLVKHRKGSRNMREPELVDMDSNKIEQFVIDTRKTAAMQYDMFVGKLVNKIGAVKDAKLEGNHVWGYSFLTVTKEGGAKEIWKTQMILNISKLGTVFNQWPTRKVKNKN